MSSYSPPPPSPSSSLAPQNSSAHLSTSSQAISVTSGKSTFIDFHLSFIDSHWISLNFIDSNLLSWLSLRKSDSLKLWNFTFSFKVNNYNVVCNILFLIIIFLVFLPLLLLLLKVINGVQSLKWLTFFFKTITMYNFIVNIDSLSLKYNHANGGKFKMDSRH